MGGRIKLGVLRRVYASDHSNVLRVQPTDPGVDDSFEVVSWQVRSLGCACQGRCYWVPRRPTLPTPAVRYIECRHGTRRTSAMPFNASLQNCMRILPIVMFETASCTEANSTCVSLWFSGSTPCMVDHTDIERPERDEMFPEFPRPEVRYEEGFIVALPN